MEILVIRVMDSRLAHPFTCIVCGPTVVESQYSRLNLSNTLKKLLAHHLNESSFVTVNIKKIIWQLPRRWISRWIAEGELLWWKKKRILLVMDDLMTSTDNRVVDIFTKISHHRNLSVLYLTNNLFLQKQTDSCVAFKFALHRPV